MQKRSWKEQIVFQLHFIIRWQLPIFWGVSSTYNLAQTSNIRKALPRDHIPSGFPNHVKDLSDSQNLPVQIVHTMYTEMFYDNFHVVATQPAIVPFTNSMDEIQHMNHDQPGKS